MQLYVVRNDEWVPAGEGFGQYDATNLEGLCLQIRDTLCRGGWIKAVDDVKVESSLGFLTRAWREVSSFADIPGPTPEAALRAHHAG